MQEIILIIDFITLKFVIIIINYFSIYSYTNNSGSFRCCTKLV